MANKGDTPWSANFWAGTMSSATASFFTSRITDPHVIISIESQKLVNANTNTDEIVMSFYGHKNPASVGLTNEQNMSIAALLRAYCKICDDEGENTHAPQEYDTDTYYFSITYLGGSEIDDLWLVYFQTTNINNQCK